MTRTDLHRCYSPISFTVIRKPLTTAQIVDEICDFVTNQQAVFLGGHYILQGS
ncbi:hypothetical protein J1F34_23765 (plasmid) [Escherichia coli]|uniref:hypothetical protein n=1 Tax=Escherichia coli TaxID=562 RepID=UPI001A931372|nr:hypothetical protein [Escherichia coli]QSW83496.1 hypothetical protein J1F34_23765 [Escherichia coli]